MIAIIYDGNAFDCVFLSQSLLGNYILTSHI